MTRERILDEFFKANPHWRTCADPDLNEYNLPLEPSAAYLFFEWLAKQHHKAARLFGIDDPAVEAKSLLAKFGEPIRLGLVRSWNQ